MTFSIDAIRREASLFSRIRRSIIQNKQPDAVRIPASVNKLSIGRRSITTFVLRSIAILAHKQNSTNFSFEFRYRVTMPVTVSADMVTMIHSILLCLRLSVHNNHPPAASSAGSGTSQCRTGSSCRSPRSGSSSDASSGHTWMTEMAGHL